MDPKQAKSAAVSAFICVIRDKAPCRPSGRELHAGLRDHIPGDGLASPTPPSVYRGWAPMTAEKTADQARRAVASTGLSRQIRRFAQNDKRQVHANRFLREPRTSPPFIPSREPSMLSSDCKTCGYPEASRVKPAGSSHCTNPWCPDDPGHCPGCGRSGPHRVLEFAGAQSQLHCARCGMDWLPDIQS